VDKLEDRPDSFYGRSTALYGLLTAESKLKWADQMIEASATIPPPPGEATS
jgi:hypothetical protein